MENYFISLDSRCDGYEDCYDQSDEIGCDDYEKNITASAENDFENYEDADDTRYA